MLGRDRKEEVGSFESLVDFSLSFIVNGETYHLNAWKSQST